MYTNIFFFMPQLNIIQTRNNHTWENCQFFKFHFLELEIFSYLNPAVAEVYLSSLPKDSYEQ